MTAVDISDPVLHEMRERIVSAHATGMPLRLRGAGTKDFYGEALDGEILETGGYAGIVEYEPSELVITARCGTRLSEIEAALDANGQFLAFEPPAFGADPTIGGVIAAGLSGPRRASAGAARDFVLGASLLTAAGDLLHFGGQVMKNVAGFDVSRLLCGSLGILGLITQLSLKVLPKPRAEVTLEFDCDANAALARFNGWRPQPLPISATSWHAGVAHVRLSGSPSAVRSARESLGGSVLDDHTPQRCGATGATSACRCSPRAARASGVCPCRRRRRSSRPGPTCSNGRARCAGGAAALRPETRFAARLASSAARRRCGVAMEPGRCSTRSIRPVSICIGA